MHFTSAAGVLWDLVLLTTSSVSCVLLIGCCVCQLDLDSVTCVDAILCSSCEEPLAFRVCEELHVVEKALSQTASIYDCQ